MRAGLATAVLVAALAGFGAVVIAVGGTAPDRANAEPATSTGPDAAAFARRVVRLIAQNRYEQAWRRLHPSHQRSAGYSAYVTCEKLSPIPGRLVSVTTGPPADKAVALPPGRIVPSKAVFVEIVLRDLATKESTIVATTIHAIPFQGGWRWILPQKRLAEYAAGRCPGGGPPR